VGFGSHGDVSGWVLLKGKSEIVCGFVSQTGKQLMWRRCVNQERRLERQLFYSVPSISGPNRSLSKAAYYMATDCSPNCEFLSAMRENVFLVPAHQIELGAGREELEACIGERRTIFAGEAFFELGFQAMQIEDIRRGVFELGGG
jgi:hypothetical protein